VSQDVVIRIDDCGTTEGIEVGPLVEGGEVIERIGERILGRVALEDVRDPINDSVLCSAGAEIDEDRVRRIEDAGIEKVRIRSVLTCDAEFGVCAKCYGRGSRTRRNGEPRRGGRA